MFRNSGTVMPENERQKSCVLNSPIFSRTQYMLYIEAYLGFNRSFSEQKELKKGFSI